MKRFILPLVLVVLSLLMMLGSGASRINRASWLGRTVLFPFSNSLLLIKANSSLKSEVASLRVKLADNTLRNLELANKLKEYQSSSAIDFEVSGQTFEIAEVIGYSGQFHQRNLMVNKGLGSGIRMESPVVSGAGIVGKVISVSDTYSLILPLNNPLFQIPVMDQSTSVQGILQSDLTGAISMNMIKLGSQISPGDTIVTSNLSTLFPKGYPVGTIERIKESSDNLFISADISPFTQVENLEHVFILNSKGKR